jgi:thioredoxin-related protein
MIRFLYGLMLLPIMGYSQSQINLLEDTTQEGIHFEKTLTWQEILKKAKMEKKYIFLECYTTWCAPCKKMDKEVYPQKVVGDLYNKYFISVKVQMDRTRRDPEQVKSWYKDADLLKEKYQVHAFPTYIFFSSDGKPLHRSAGAMDVIKFSALAKEAQDPEKQSYTLEERYAQARKFDVKKMSNAELKQLALSLKNSTPGLANKMAQELISRLTDKKAFIDHYSFISQFNKNSEIQKLFRKHVNSLNEQEMFELFTKANFSFIWQFMQTSESRGFKFLFQHLHKIDSIMNKDYVYKLWYGRMFLNEIIYNEEIAPLLDKSAVLDWDMVYEKIKQKYDTLVAQMNVVQGKIAWFAAQKDWRNYTKHIVFYMDKYGSDLQNSWHLNQYAWEVFLFSQDKSELSKALSWSENAVMYAPIANWMDTYANLLYKLGRVPIAIKWEEIAASLDSKDKDIQKNLEKMNKGEPTWKN